MMTNVLLGAALVCTVLGLLSAAIAGVRSRDARLSLAVLLDFLLAAALLRLSANTTIGALATAAVIIGIRKALPSACRGQAAPAAETCRSVRHKEGGEIRTC
jgi:hypothetical protein